MVSLTGTYAQEETPARIRGLRLGYDLSRHALPYLKGGRTAFGASADMEIVRNLYAVAEFGIQDVDYTGNSFDYLSTGYYGRMGIDRNFLKNLDDNQYEMVFGGIRIGYANQDQSAPEIIILPNYWGKEYFTSVEENNINTVWLEFAGGVKAELFKNFFIGWSVRARLRLHQTHNPNMSPVYVPGFGNGLDKTSLGFTYSVFYRIPVMKYKPVPLEE